jgi:antitoxin component YwqK of YwqJK toxin-antitoxin module
MNKLTIIGIALLLISLVGYSQDTTYFDARGGKGSSEDYAYYRIITPTKNAYQTIDYFSSGKVRMRGNSLSKDSLLKHGVYEYFLENGLKEKTMAYRNNLMQGAYSLYYQSGSLRETGFYKKDKLSGKNTQYYESGKIKREAVLKAGKYNGRMAYYNEGGIKIGEGKCKDDGWDGKWTKYDNNGNKLTEIFYGTFFKIKDCKIKIKPSNYVWSLFEKESFSSYNSYLIRCVSNTQDKRNPITNAPELRLLVIEDKDAFDDIYRDPISKEKYTVDFTDKVIIIEESFILGFESESRGKVNVLALKFKNGKSNFIIETVIDADNAKRNEEILKDIIAGVSSY